jgi:hypothetical protein
MDYATGYQVHTTASVQAWVSAAQHGNHTKRQAVVGFTVMRHCSTDCWYVSEAGLAKLFSHSL